ncbi:MAG TPA: hypothetical protein VH352_09120, partial [Pseudonocardiaceae bacterium]|nr:hypothetical protein [Pseudonocardiaceae bacterium]
MARQATTFGLISVTAAAILGLTSVFFKALDSSAAFTLWTVPVALTLFVVGVLSAVMGRIAELREKNKRAEREWNERVVPLLRLPVRDGRLPRLRELTDVELGTTPTRYTAGNMDEYVPRTLADEKLRVTLTCTQAPFPFVLLYGDSKAGKSRTMAEAARRQWPAAPVIVPRNGEAAATLAGIEPPLILETSPALVWLDDLTAADLDYLTTAVLDSWSHRAIVVGTMTTMRYRDTLRTGSEVGTAARTALHRAVVHELPFELSEDERSAAQRAYPQEKLSHRDETPVSIGETLVGGDELARKLRAGRDDCPPGQAVARAAVDVRRAGLSRPISEDELKHLFPLYLRHVNSGIAPTADQFTSGLTWAATPVASQVAILRQVRTARWEVLDYVVEAEAGEHSHTERPIPGFLWPELLAMTAVSDAFGLARAAESAGQLDFARDAMRQAQQHPPSASMASSFLGTLLEKQNDVIGAKTAYQQAIDSGDTYWAPAAAYDLGNLLAKEGDVTGAKIAYQQTIDSGQTF